MMKSKFLSLGGMLFALCAMLMVAGCSKDDGTVGYYNPGGTVVPGADGMAIANVTGFVSAPGAVTVTSGTQTVQTDRNGMYTLSQVKVVNGRVIVKFEKEGYMTVVRSVPAQSSIRLNVAMSECDTQTFPASSAATISIPASYGYTPEMMKVELPADGFVTEGGAAYTGSVTASFAYVDPDDETFTEEMPGDLTAVRTDNSEAQLISYGMVAVELADAAGNKLNLAEGKKATLTFPVPDKFKGGELPSSIPLWSFDEETGLWVEEGVANLNETSDAYVGQVSHFSWHNLDYPELRATLKVKVQDNTGRILPNVLVDVDGQRAVYTDNTGIATCVVPSNTDMVIRVASEAYGNYAEVVDETYGWTTVDETKIVKQNVTLTPQETKQITLTMPVRIPIVSGRITNVGSGTQVCVVWIQYGMNETVRSFTDYLGNFSVMAPANYRGAATFVAQYGDGYRVTQAINITDADQVLTLTANSSSQSVPGVILVLGTNLNRRYTLPDASDECWNAVRITERGLEVYAGTDKGQGEGEWMYTGVNLFIPNYAEGTTSYTSSENSFSYMHEGMGGMGGWAQLSSYGELTINVTKSGDTYTFKIANADGQLMDRDLGMDWNSIAPVKFTVEFSAKPAVEEN